MNQKSFRLLGIGAADKRPAQPDQPIFDMKTERYLTKRQLADNLNVSIGLIDKLIAKEGLPRIKLGRAVRFHQGEVATFLKRRKVP